MVSWFVVQVAGRKVNKQALSTFKSKMKFMSFLSTITLKISIRLILIIQNHLSENIQ